MSPIFSDVCGRQILTKMSKIRQVVKTNLLTTSFISNVTPILSSFFITCRRQGRMRRALKIFEELGLRCSSSQSTKLSLQSSELGLPPPPCTHRRVCIPQRGEHTRLREMGSQFQRGDRHCTLCSSLFCYAVPRINIFPFSDIGLPGPPVSVSGNPKNQK